MGNPFKSSSEQCKLQSQIYDKLTAEERKALEQMQKENIFFAISEVLTALSTGYPAHPTPWEDVNKAVGDEVVKCFG